MIRLLFRAAAGLAAALGFFYPTLNGQTGCPGCEIVLPDSLQTDTIFLGTASDGQVNQLYQADIGFRVPKTTTPVASVDPTVPPGLPISKITIQSLSNLPPGLSWEVSRTSFTTAEITDGCVRLCGVPLDTGLFMVEVNLTAQVLFVTQSTSFSFPLRVMPSTSTNAGFTLINDRGCGVVNAQFVNNNPSEGKEGFQYFWDFGNGLTSTAETPPRQRYDSAGIYVVNYQAQIDTADVVLTSVKVLDLDCGDLFNNAPDVYVRIMGENDSILYQSPMLDDVRPPISFQPNLSLERTGNYRLEVWDEDGGINGADDRCGSINFNLLSPDTLSNGALKANINIFRPTTNIQVSDSIFVFAQPAAPQISAFPARIVCEGDTIVLSSLSDSNLVWYRDTIAFSTAAAPSILQAGFYHAVFTSVDGCQSQSTPVELQFNPLPAEPRFSVENNFLTLNQPELFPRTTQYDWYLEGDSLDFDAEFDRCAVLPGHYRLVATNLLTGCSNDFGLEIELDSNYVNCRPSDVQDIQKPSNLKISPNPFHENLQVSVDTDQPGVLWVGFFDLQGKSVVAPTLLAPGTTTDFPDLGDLPAGMYLLYWQNQSGQRGVEKVIRQ